MKEKDFWQKIRDNLKLEYMQRVENELEPGWGDVHYINNGYPGWMELKAEETFPQRIKFEPNQPNWLANYWAKGGYCYIFLHTQDKNLITIWAGKDARKLDVVGGCAAVPPILQVKMDVVGWREIYELFKVPASHLRETV